MPVKLDLYRSTLRLGVQDFRNTYAVRRATVTGLTNNNFALTEAIQASLNENIIAHPAFPQLPLHTVEATRRGPDSAHVNAVYRPTDAFFGDPQNPFLNARFRGAYIPTTWYQLPIDEAGDPAIDATTGLPNGKLDTPDVANPHIRPKRWIFTNPVSRILVPVILAQNPFPQVASAQGRTNLNGLSGLGGYTFPPETLRFDKVDTDWLGGNSLQPDTYPSTYVFTAMLFGFVRQVVVFNSTNNEWEARIVREHSPIAFPTFPIA